MTSVRHHLKLVELHLEPFAYLTCLKLLIILSVKGFASYMYFPLWITQQIILKRKSVTNSYNCLVSLNAFSCSLPALSKYCMCHILSYLGIWKETTWERDYWHKWSSGCPQSIGSQVFAKSKEFLLFHDGLLLNRQCWPSGCDIILWYSLYRSENLW